MKAIKISDFANNKISESDVVRRVLYGEKELYEILIRGTIKIISGYKKPHK